MRSLLTILALVLACGVLAEAQKTPFCERHPTHHRCEPISEGWRLTNSWKSTLEGTEEQPSFEFPKSPGWVGKLAKAWDGAMLGQTWNATVSIVANPTTSFEFGYGPDNPCLTPASARPYFERYDWNTNWNSPEGEFLRWWSNPQTLWLEDGTFSLTVPFLPDQWSSVFGKFGTHSAEAEYWFGRSLMDPGNVGFTFGGGCFFGHGVWVDGGRAWFTSLSFEVL